mmetsp:Transcript_18113/g.45606  ORF Transcript_18113/g.45606 Transcript_18113/m.45606 type:complete len:286 (-) Transcript_18113:502-1359(-)
MTVGHVGVVAQRRAHGSMHEAGRVRRLAQHHAPGPQHHALPAERGARDVVLGQLPAAARHHRHLDDAHLVGGQRAGLVGADHGGAAQGLHTGQRAHDGVVCGHAPRAQRQARGHHRRQALGDGRHSQRHRDLEVVDAALHPASQRRVLEAVDVDDPHQHADARDHLGQQLTKLVQLGLEGRHHLLLVRHGVANGANGGGRAGGHHHAARAPRHHQRAREQHVDLVLVHGARVVHHALVLVGGRALARQQRLVHPQHGGVDVGDAHVRRHLAAHCHLHYVARHEVG